MSGNASTSLAACAQLIHGNRAVLDAVAAATRKRRGHARPVLDEGIIRTAIDGPVVEWFVREAEAVGMSVVRAGTATLLTTVEVILEDPERRWGGSPSRHGQLRELPHLLLEPDLVARYSQLSELKGTLVNPTDDELFAADVGLVGVSAAIAETGSLVRASGADRPRSIALVPPTLLAVVEASRIVADLYDWLAGLDPLAMAADAVVITGPSRTADIGMKLVTGVHGPGAVHIVLLDDG